MLDFSWSHIVIVLIVALVVVGPKDLPRLMHMIGRWLGKARAMADEFRKSFDEMARQAELDELRKEIEALRSERPLADLDRPIDHGIMPDEGSGAAKPEEGGEGEARSETEAPPAEPAEHAVPPDKPEAMP